MESLSWSPGRAAIVGALFAVRQELPAITRSRKADVKMESGGTYSYKYADLASIMDKAMPVLFRHGLLVTNGPTAAMIGDRVLFGVVTDIHHVPSGEWVRSTVLLPFVAGKGNAAQVVGSLLTFGMRYNLGAMLALALQDDDARSAAPPPAQQRAHGPAKVEVPEENKAMVSGIVTLLNQRVNGSPVFDPAEMKAWTTRAMRDQGDKAKLDAAYQEVHAILGERRAKYTEVSHG